MPVYRDEKRKTWYTSFTYKDFTGQTKRKLKRGFKTSREAKDWERAYKVKNEGRLEMKFADFCELYIESQKLRVRENTAEAKRNIIEQKLLPYFGEKAIQDISPADVMMWQNVMINTISPETGRTYSKSYLRAIHNQLAAIFNHAMKFYHLQENPARLAGSMGSKRNAEMKFWTKDEYMQFIENIDENTEFYYLYEILYWCGLRVGEALALTVEDIRLEKGIIDVNKTYMRIHKEDIIHDPKTDKGRRQVQMPQFLTDELREYINKMPMHSNEDRLFNMSKCSVNRELKKTAEIADLTPIRVHDLRHSHVSLLIDMGYSAVAIGNRVGHESINITLRYAHMFPNVQQNMAKDLNALRV